MYVDAKRETYKALGFKRFGLLGTLWTVFSKKGRDATAEVCTAARTEPRNFLPTAIVVLVCFFFLFSNILQTKFACRRKKQE